MKEEADEDLSLLDLISYYESGPVLKERTPDIVRTPSHPEELSYSNKISDCDEGKSLTKRVKLANLYKKALGLTDVPGGSPGGAQGYRPRSAYEQQDFEASHRGGFGGPSVIDVQEDKPPSNIQRREYNKPINIRNKTESKDYFSFLETGRLRRRRISGVTRAMNTEQQELLKLAKALHMSGHVRQADEIVKLAQEGYGENMAEWGTGGAAIGGAIGGLPGAAIGAVIGAGIGWWNVYDARGNQQEAAARLGQKAQAFVESLKGIGSFFGDSVNSNSVLSALGADESTPPDFSALYEEIIRVWKDQDFDWDWHWGFAGDDAGDFSNISTFTTGMQALKGKRIDSNAVKAVVSADSDYNRFGGDETWNGIVGSIGPYIAAWNALYEFEKEASTPPSPTPGPTPGPTPIGRQDWAILQNRLNALGHKGANGEPLVADGLWGPQTAHAWRSATDGAAKPASPAAALERLSGLTREEDRTQPTGISDKILRTYLTYDGTNLTLTERDKLVDRIGDSGPATTADADFLMGRHKPKVLEAFNADKENNEDMAMILSYLADTQDSEDATPEVNLNDYYNGDGTSTYMRKSDGELFYGKPTADGIELMPLANRTQDDSVRGDDFLSPREQRRMMSQIRGAERAGEITSEQRKAFKRIIVGTRKMETGRRSPAPEARRRRGREAVSEGQSALTGQVGEAIPLPGP